jgi:hypothetical protein
MVGSPVPDCFKIRYFAQPITRFLYVLLNDCELVVVQFPGFFQYRSRRRYLSDVMERRREEKRITLLGPIAIMLRHDPCPVGYLARVHTGKRRFIVDDMPDELAYANDPGVAYFHFPAGQLTLNGLPDVIVAHLLKQIFVQYVKQGFHRGVR